MKIKRKSINEGFVSGKVEVNENFSASKSVLRSEELRHCPKNGAWLRRANHLLDDLTIMKNLCRRELRPHEIIPK